MTIFDHLLKAFRSSDVPMRRWTAEELARVRAEIEAMKGTPEDQLGIDHHMLIVDYLVQRYLPTDDARTEKEWQATRRRMEDRVRRTMAGEVLEPRPLAPDTKASDDPEFEAWLEQLSKRKRRDPTT